IFPLTFLVSFYDTSGRFKAVSDAGKPHQKNHITLNILMFIQARPYWAQLLHVLIVHLATNPAMKAGISEALKARS
ncbi:MAG: hypothetical protein WBN41_15945, partial [Lysobacterales bacterium]